MFSYIFVVNKTTPAISKSIDILKKTKNKLDSIIVVNYNNYNIEYRNISGIQYYHVKQSRKMATNTNLPKNSDVVLISGGEFTITESFVKDLYKHYDKNCLCTLRTDNVSENGKFVESDFRIGSVLTTKSFSHFALAFNTGTVPMVGDTPEETAIIAQGNGIPFKLLPNVRVLVTEPKKQKITNNGVTILIAGVRTKIGNDIKQVLKDGDRIYEFSNNERLITKFINQKVVESPNECIIIVNPDTIMTDPNMVNRIRGLFNNKRCLLFDVRDDIITDNAWLVVPKSKYVYSNKSLPTIKDVQRYILSYNTSITYTDKLPDKKDRILYCKPIASSDMISIIIPFMFNGDRWPLFEASIDKLYEVTKDYDNIEIVVHETASARYISPKFIKKYNLSYLFSQYDGLFHRAWSLNVAAKHIAKGSVFVFFDADLIVDKDWVEELVSCDKMIPYIGWGKMMNLNKKGTDYYLQTKKLQNLLERTRLPSIIAAAAGINIISRDMFYNIGGWPESYKDMGYGGEDNSYAFKMLSLGCFGDSIDPKKYSMPTKAPEYRALIDKHTFRSSVYHLFHGHKTKRDQAITYSVFNKHKNYNKQDWLEHIRKHSCWGTPLPSTMLIPETDEYVNESLLFVHLNSTKPLITVCLMGLSNPDILMDRLREYISLNVSINLILCIGNFDIIPDNTKIAIHNMCKNFHSYSLVINKENIDINYAKFVLLNKAKFEYSADFIVVTDDSVVFTSPEELVLGATVLDQERFNRYGAIRLDQYTTDHSDKFSDTNILDTPITTFRRDVLDDWGYDPNYEGDGWIDNNHIKSKGFKLGIINNQSVKEDKTKTKIMPMKDPVLDTILKKYDMLDGNVIKGYKQLNYPLVTIAMLSFKRYDKLIEALERHISNGTPLNLVLRVQCCEELNGDQINNIKLLCSKFHGHIVKFTETNLGSGEPRHDAISIALKEFDTPYIMTTDDDMMWKPNSIITQLSFFETRPEYGMIASTCEPDYPRSYKDENGKWVVDTGWKDVFIDALMCGSATSIYRREIFKDVEYDKEYKIGLGDFDLCRQIVDAGWKIGIMNIPELKSLNDAKNNSRDYNAMRYNRPIIENSRARFIKKWGKMGIHNI